MAKKSKLPHFVSVTWTDAHGDLKEWLTSEVPHYPYVVETRGWLLKDDEDGLTIAAELIHDPEEPVWRGRTFVPRGMVKEVQRLTLPRKAKRSEPQIDTPPTEALP